MRGRHHPPSFHSPLSLDDTTPTICTAASAALDDTLVERPSKATWPARLHHC
ncbi:hypothetical protein OB919_10345 [Halobacteria archaeon AArc-curdl1]|uniref:Uncharacterized protein n=1 Tax=Natronosalvus hydrolyticus TaxID=2979988 RepID=A0AAP3E708_9EURY|nr:hypothetical protein [Halobacteria archaeon AArc-curdl1]